MSGARCRVSGKADHEGREGEAHALSVYIEACALWIVGNAYASATASLACSTKPV